jgi:hypothetical protein
MAESLGVAPPPADTGDAELAAAEAAAEVGGAEEMPGIAEAPLAEIANAPLPEIPEAPVPELDEAAIPPVPEGAIPPVPEAAPAPESAAPGTSAPGTVGSPPADGQETPNGRRP